jgi:hypothetical protein
MNPTAPTVTLGDLELRRQRLSFDRAEAKRTGADRRTIITISDELEGVEQEIAALHRDAERAQLVERERIRRAKQDEATAAAAQRAELIDELEQVGAERAAAVDSINTAFDELLAAIDQWQQTGHKMEILAGQLGVPVRFAYAGPLRDYLADRLADRLPGPTFDRSRGEHLDAFDERDLMANVHALRAKEK